MSESTLAEVVGADGRKTYQHRSNSLFKAVDTDGSGMIDKEEFGKLYDMIKVEVQAELDKEAALEKSAAKAKRMTKMMGMVAAILLGIVAVSVAANAALMYVVSDALKDSSVAADGSLMVKGSNKTVAVDMAPSMVAWEVDDYVNAFIEDEKFRSAAKEVSIELVDGQFFQSTIQWLEVRTGNNAMPMKFNKGAAAVDVAYPNPDHNLKFEMALVGVNHPIYPAVAYTRVLPVQDASKVGSLPVLGAEYASYGTFLVNTTDIEDYVDMIHDDTDDYVGWVWEEWLPFSAAFANNRRRQLKKLPEYVKEIAKAIGERLPRMPEGPFEKPGSGR